jgi:hypothetical protein
MKNSCSSNRSYIVPFNNLDFFFNFYFLIFNPRVIILIEKIKDVICFERKAKPAGFNVFFKIQNLNINVFFNFHF